jgi:hypothetical protein
MEELVIGSNLSWMDGFPSVHEPPANYVASKKGRKIPTKEQSARRERRPDSQRSLLRMPFSDTLAGKLWFQKARSASL